MAWAALLEKAVIGCFAPEIANSVWNRYVPAAPPLRARTTGCDLWAGVYTVESQLTANRPR